ncbi:amidohydrolase family protein [Bradyrhizobium sediminis]|jgi:predicted TIM-barrel fold metal-dependent hydrolase|uniref:Amidohydrolase family protein n=1 Tax=Bradyrhizobium sediminis TaxID=2840469 RepID=A0A975RL50_9BRAD|nr:amidohydrolase family protein [Bradyrhizobium sediminis]QWG11339.1 amidohydrolase family protein [Bradyrhizobium sediminis]
MNVKPQEAPACQGPNPIVDPPGFAVPANACDTHAHVIGPADRFSLVANRSYTPPPALEAAYLGMLDSLGMARGVLVQISVYGTDNRCMVESCKAHPDRLRGVAVVSPDVDDGELETLDAAGVRGIRINVLFGGGVAIDEMERLAARVAPLGWHLQLLIDARNLPELGPRIAKLPVEVVIDHMGHMPMSAGVAHPGFQWMLRLLKDGKAWTKLSGAYRISQAGAPFHDTQPFAQALVSAAPERCLWGSDWPHVAVEGPMFNTGALLDLLPLWVPEETVRKRILVDNPARLYGFPTATAE